MPSPRSASVLRLGFAVVLAVFTCACAQVPAPPKAVTELRLTAAHRTMEGSIALGNGLRIDLPAPIDPGTEWVLLANESRVLALRVGLRAAPGAGATVLFRGIHLGRSLLRFAALDPVSSQSSPTDLYTVAVEVD
ncbi:MAG: hypothetical protein ACREFX_07150, partial [Opitutaceae bacterium]